LQSHWRRAGIIFRQPPFELFRGIIGEKFMRGCNGLKHSAMLHLVVHLSEEKEQMKEQEDDDGKKGGNRER